ncbi:hypothetical protein HK096_011237 [Nowakowskiella sp. JEL0078]|nr:hypothetical protein HK096_011237 [Nowakowskiella sp. JEL0078]
MFKSFVQSLMRSATPKLQTCAVQFISNWMPITEVDASLIAIENLFAGLLETRKLDARNFDKVVFEQQKQDLINRKLKEEARLTMRGKLLRQLLEIPGSSTKLAPVPECPGYFVDMNSSLMFTKGILVHLPIHPKSSIIVSRPLPAIPGVPSGVTTVPPVYMDAAWAEKQQPPRSRYEYLERTSPIPGLPFGYTYAPTVMIQVGSEIKEDQNTVVQEEAQNPQSEIAVKSGQERKFSKSITEKHQFSRKVVTRKIAGIVRKGQLLTAANIKIDPEQIQNSKNLSNLKIKMSQIPPGTTRQPLKSDTVLTETRKIPLGFLVACPFPGFDITAFDRYTQPISAIYGRVQSQTQSAPRLTVSNDMKSSQRPDTTLSKNQENSMLEGYTLDRHPVLWPSKIQ